MAADGRERLLPAVGRGHPAGPRPPSLGHQQWVGAGGAGWGDPESPGTILVRLVGLGPLPHPSLIPVSSQPCVPFAVCAGVTSCAHRNSRFGTPTHSPVTLVSSDSSGIPGDTACDSFSDRKPPSLGCTAGWRGDRAGAGELWGPVWAPAAPQGLILSRLPRSGIKARQRWEAGLGSPSSSSPAPP